MTGNLHLQTSSTKGTVKHVLSLPDKSSIHTHNRDQAINYVQGYLDLHGETLLSNCELANVVSGRTGIPVYIVYNIVRELTI